MTQPNLPGVPIPAQLSPTLGDTSYWNREAEAYDAQRKKYRSIPVPAHLNNNQKHIDDATRLELLVEHLATKNDFGDFDMRQLQGKTPEDVIDQISMWADQVHGAPPEKQEDAKRSFGGHLEDFGAAIGRGLLTGVGKVFGAPGISHTLSAISFPGEEITAQILYNFAKLIPGEQDIERGVRQWKEDNPDAPWWKQGFLTPAVREHGFGVPMGVHLPMEIIFDPLNLIPVGAAFKLAKPTMVMYKLMGKGKNAPEAFRLTRRLQRYQKYANKKAQLLLDEIEETQRLMYETNFDEVGVNPYTGEMDELEFDVREAAGMGSSREAGQRYKTGGDEKMTGFDSMPQRQKDQMDEQNQELAKDRIGDAQRDIDESYKQVFEIGEVEEFDALNHPAIRGIPLHGSSQDITGLYAIAHDNAYWAKLGESGRRAKWALQLMWHTGIRPHEIKYIEWDSILNMLNDPKAENHLLLTIREGGKKGDKASRRYLDADAVKFFRTYRDAADGRGTHAKSTAGFQLPAMRAHDTSEISHLQQLFVDAAKSDTHKAYGEKLLSFYDNNKNYAYVFRLSKANDMFSKTKKSYGLRRLMQMMGHASTVHTSRYVSFFQHQYDTKVKNILQDVADNNDEINAAIEAANKELAEGEWRKALDPEDLKRLETTGTGKNAVTKPLGIFATVNPGVQSRKGFTDLTKDTYIAQQTRLRKDIIRASLSKEIDGEVIFPVSLRTQLQQGEVNEALSAVQQLQAMALSLQDNIIQKRFITNVKELKSQKGLPKATKDKLKEIRATAQADSAQMQEWIQPIIDVAGEHLATLSKVTGKDLVDMPWEAYSVSVDAFRAPFQFLAQTELARIDYMAKAGSGLKGRTLPSVSSKFKYLFAMHQVTKTRRVLTEKSDKLRKTLDKDLNEEQLAEATHFRETSEIGWIVRPRQHGKNIDDTGKVMEVTKTKDNPAGEVGNPAYRPGNTDNWMITGWLTHENQVWNPLEHRVSDIGFAAVTRLGSKTFKGDRVNLAQRKQDHIIPILDLDAWALVVDDPIPPQLIKMASHGGVNALSAKEVAEHLFKLGKTPNGVHNMKSIQSYIERAFSRDRLRRNKHLVQEEEGDWHYRWSEEVQDEFNKRMKEAPGDFGYGRAGEPPQPPPSRPGDTTSGGEFPDDWSKFEWVDEANQTRTLGDTIIVPRAMEQVMQWANTEWTKIFQKLPPVLYKPLSKMTRAVAGHTAGASEAAKLRWTFYMSKMEGQEVASNLGHMLEPMHKDFGSNRRSGRGTAVGFAKDMDVEINPKTGAFKPETIAKDYYREEGWEISPDHKLFDPEMAKLAGKPLDENQVLGPIATMEAKFKEFATDAPDVWTETLINAQRRKYNHLHILQDMTNYLNSSRDDIKKIYDVTTEAGMKQLAWWDRYHQVMPHLYDLLRKTGFDVDKDPSILGMEISKFRESFVPSAIISQNDELMLKGVSSLGAIPSQMIKRPFHWQVQHMMEQGAPNLIIKHGLYHTDPVVAIQRTAEAYYDWIARQKFMDEYQRLGYLKSELTGYKAMQEKISTFINAKGAAKRAAELSPSEERVANKFFGANWKNMTDADLDKRSIELQKMSLAWKELTSRETRELAPKAHKLRMTALPEDANLELRALVKDLYEPQSSFITWPSVISNTMRLLSTGADLGVMLLHGIGGIGVMLSPSPWVRKERLAWAKGVGRMGRALWQPEVRAKWYETTQLTRRDMQKYGVGFFRSTHIEDLPLPGVFTKGRYWPELERKGVKEARRVAEGVYAPMERMMQGFGYFLDVSKTEMWKVQSTAIRRNAGALQNPETGEWSDVDPAMKATMEYELNDLAAAMNAMHGTLQPAVVGLPQKQRVFESAFLLYAALYRRSAAAMITNLMSGIPEATYKAVRKGDITGAAQAFQKRKWRRGQALSAVSGMLAAGAAIGFAIKESGLNDDVFTMGSADFMSVKIGNMRLGIGTPFYSFLRMGKDLVDQMENDPRGLGEVNFSDNALLKWFRSGASPVTSIGIDVFSGADFIGDPLRDTTGGWEVNKIGDRITRNLIPFWLDSLGESVLPMGSGELPASASLAEFFGLRVSPQSPYGRMKAAKNVAILMSTDPDVVKWREEQIAKGLPVDELTIPKLYLQRLIEESPEMQKLELEISADVQRRGSYDRKRQDDYIEQIRLNREGRGKEDDPEVNPQQVRGLTMKLEGVADQFNSGLINGRELRQLVELLEAENRGRNQAVAAAFDDVVKHFEDLREARLEDPERYEHAGRHILDLYYDLYRSEVTASTGLHDEYGNFDAEAFQKKHDDFKAQIDFLFTDENGVTYGWDYIQARREQGKDLPPLIQELNKARNEDLLPFWNLSEKLGPKNAEYINHWRSLETAEAKEYYALKNPQVRPLLRVLGKIQDNFRRQRPDIDYLLVKFYDYNALTARGKEYENARRRLIISNPKAMKEPVGV